MIRRLMLAVASVLMLQDVVAAQKEGAACQRLHDWNQPVPTLAQCRADLSAWMKADEEWENTVKSSGKLNLRPVELLSSEELYRRRREASACEHLFAVEAEKISERKDLSVTEKQSRWMDEVMNTKNCMSHELSLSMEIISRNESVIDKHFLWEELLLMNATPIR
jgi:hypothetical protein